MDKGIFTPNICELRKVLKDNVFNSLFKSESKFMEVEVGSFKINDFIRFLEELEYEVEEQAYMDKDYEVGNYETGDERVFFRFNRKGKFTIVGDEGVVTELLKEFEKWENNKLKMEVGLNLFKEFEDRDLGYFLEDQDDVYEKEEVHV